MGAVMERPPLTWSMIAGVTQDANPDHSNASADLDYHPMGAHEGFQKCWPL
jgi:hypothetical protein